MNPNFKIINFIQNIGLFTLTSAALKLISFLIIVWLGNELSPTIFGDWSLSYSFLTGIVTFCGVGLYEIAVSNTNKIIDKDKRDDKGVSAFFKMSIGVVAIAAFLFSLYQQDLNSEVFIKIISVLFSGVFLSFFVLQTNIARIEEKYNISILFNFAAPLLAWIAGFYLAYLGFGGSIFYLGFFVGLLLSVAFFYRYFYGTKIINLYLLKNKKDIYKNIIPFFYVAVFGWLSGYGGNLFVAIF